jgi:O-antigen/teichoic acid export membrane protein
MEKSMNLRRRVAHGLFWSILSTWTGMVSGFVILVVLGRLLGPESFGLVAMAMIVIAFGDLFVVDSGFGEAIMQRKELNDDHCDAAFWLLIGSSVIAMAVFMVVAPLAAASFEQPLVADLVRVLSLTLPLGALSAVPSALLSRELRFRALAARGLISGTGGGTAAIGMALACQRRRENPSPWRSKDASGG